VILDTNALSAFAEGNQAVRETIANAAGPYLPVIVLGEYRFGLMGSPERDRRLHWLEALASHWTVLKTSLRKRPCSMPRFARR